MRKSKTLARIGKIVVIIALAFAVVPFCARWIRPALPPSMDSPNGTLPSAPPDRATIPTPTPSVPSPVHASGPEASSARPTRSPEDDAALDYAFLAAPLKNADGLSASAVASAKNQAMDRLLELRDIPADYADRMAAILADRSNDELLRNFAAQHLGLYAGRLSALGRYDQDSAPARKVRASLSDALAETDDTIGGAALLALAELSRFDPEVSASSLGGRAASMLSNPDTHIQTRIAAAQVCGDLGVREAIPQLRALSTARSAPLPLRLAAAHALSLFAPP